MTPFRKAFFWTAGLIVSLSMLSTAGALGGDFESSTSRALAMFVLWYVAAGIGVIGLVTSIVLLFTSKGKPGKKAAAAGILAGIAVGVLALAATCFANLNNMGI